jgi:hypothetical protein
MQTVDTSATEKVALPLRISRRAALVALPLVGVALIAPAAESKPSPRPAPACGVISKDEKELRALYRMLPGEDKGSIRVILQCLSGRRDSITEAARGFILRAAEKGKTPKPLRPLLDLPVESEDDYLIRHLRAYKGEDVPLKAARIRLLSHTGEATRQELAWMYRTLRGGGQGGAKFAREFWRGPQALVPARTTKRLPPSRGLAAA